METIIKNFLREMHILTLSVLERAESKTTMAKTANQDFEVYSASCFYAFDEEGLSLIFKSNSESRHILLGLQSPIVGVNIATQTKILKRIKGAQIKAYLMCAHKRQEDLYHHRFPFARLGEGRIYALEILWAKYTDNTLLSAKKIQYQNPKFT